MKRFYGFLASSVGETLTVILMSMLRFLYCGFKYYPQLDDYIQYHNYTSGHTISEYWKAVERVGLLGARPLAGLGDIYFWSFFWEHMIVAVLIIATLYALSAVIFKKIFSRYFRCGWAFLIIYTLLPLGFEGAYWMSASTRLVVGLFFAALSCLALVKFSDGKGARYAVLAIVAQTVAFCYYEQILVFSFALNILVMLLEFKRSHGDKRKNLRPLLGLSGIGSAAFYFALTSFFSQGSVYASRGEMILPTTRYYFDNFLPNIAGQIGSAFFGGGFYTLAKGFYRGIKMIFTDGAILYLLAMLIFIAAAVAAVILRKREEKSEEKHMHLLYQLVFSLLIAAAPVSIFLVIGNPWFSLRNTLPSLVGIALAADGIIMVILEKINKTKITIPIYATLIGLMAFACLTASVSEIHDYKLTYENDNRVAKLLIENFTEDELATPTVIFNLDASYLEDENYNWHEHIHGTTESSWALRGMLNSYFTYGSTNITPMALKERLYAAWNYSIMQLEGFERYLYYHPETGEMEQVYLTKLAEGEYEIVGDDGVPYFRVTERDKIAYYEPIG